MSAGVLPWSNFLLDGSWRLCIAAPDDPALVECHLAAGQAFQGVLITVKLCDSLHKYMISLGKQGL
jgi:hypothetical protein